MNIFFEFRVKITTNQPYKAQLFYILRVKKC